MRLLDTISETLFRQTADGRSVYMPWGKLGSAYFVADRDADRLRRVFRWFFIVQFVVAIPLLGIVSVASPRKFIVGILVIIAVSTIVRASMTRGLPRATAKSLDLPRRSVREALTVQGRQLGTRTLWGMLLASLAMDAGQVMVAATDHAWWAWVGIVMFTTMSATFVWQIRLVRQLRAVE